MTQIPYIRRSVHLSEFVFLVDQTHMGKEEEAGPSGISRREVLTLSGLNVSDDEDDEEEDKAVEDEEEDLWCNQAMDDWPWTKRGRHRS